MRGDAGEPAQADEPGQKRERSRQSVRRRPPEHRNPQKRRARVAEQEILRGPEIMPSRRARRA